MNKELLMINIRRFCEAKGEKITVACTAAGVGKNFLSNMTRGQTPSVASVADLAAYLGVSTSDLVGDAAVPADLAPLAEAWAELNDEGRERMVQYAEDLTLSGRYKKHNQSEMEA